MATPCILITSCSNFPAENILKDILNVDILPDGQTVVDNVVGYNWFVDTKYYTADVRLCLTGKRTIGDQHFADCVEAFIVYFDPDQESSFSRVKSWNSYLDQLEPDIKMLVCDKCTDKTGVTRLEAHEWCIDNGFELVELNAEVESDSETEDDFLETTGIKRIVQSLHAHTWSNLTLKDSRCAVSPYIRQLMQEEHNAKKENSNTEQTIENTDQCNDVSAQQSALENSGTVHVGNCENGVKDENHSICDNLNKDVETDESETTRDMDKTGCDKCELLDVAKGDNSSSVDADSKVNSKSEKKKLKQPTNEERLDSLLPSEDMELFETLGNEDPGDESFEKLFERFANMKEKANALPPQERKKYAENVAVAFWKAMGGDEDEIGGLDDSD